MLKIVIVDDNETNLMFMKLLVKSIPDSAPVFFTSSLDALKFLQAEPVDLLIVDYMMPELDGIQLIERFRMHAHSVGVPIVMVTAYDERPVRAKAVAKGANDFLGKPVDMVEFNSRISNLLALRTAQNTLRDVNQWLAEEIIKATAKVRSREEEIIWRLTKAAEYRDECTGNHIMRIAKYSRIISAGISLPIHDQQMIYLASPMHDIGKVAIPDQILRKPGPLNDEERTVMQTHTTIGREILSDSEAELIMVAGVIALSHHERVDGQGYPHGVKGEAIPIAARVVAVADVFDALTQPRPYKEAWPLERAREELARMSGTHLETACVRALLAQWDAVTEIARLV